MSKDLFTHLILKSFREGLTASEQKALDAWLDEATSHRELFEQLQQSWERSEDYKSDFQLDLDRGWASVQEKVKNVEQRRTVVPFYRSTPVRIAASLVLLLGIAWIGLNIYIGLTDEGFVTYKTGEDEVIEVSLPDGSLVWLNENSSLEMEKKFSVRNVYLQGEALFDVQHNAEKPFTVDAGETRTSVLGTTFNVKAPDGAQWVKVSLLEGKVEFQSPDDEKVVLTPGEEALFDAKLGTLTKKATGVANAIAWQTNSLTFDNTPLETVLENVKDYFQADLAIDNRAEETCLFTGTFKDPSLEEVLEVLTYTFDIERDTTHGMQHLIIHQCR